MSWHWHMWGKWIDDGTWASEYGGSYFRQYRRCYKCNKRRTRAA